MQLIQKVLLGSFLSILGLNTASAETSKSATPFYTGSVSCRECHDRFYQLWAPSKHGLAMQAYSLDLAKQLTPQKEALKIGNATYRAEIGTNEGWVVEKNSTGEKKFPIVHALGGKNVYYFLTQLDRGRLQTLPVAYDVRRKEWYDTAQSAVRHFPGMPDTALNWTEPQYTFNTSCHSCHVSQLTNNYDLKAETYHTIWAEPGINCETCHGPASGHVQAARELAKGQKMTDLKLISNKTFSQEQANSMCGSCHAKMAPLTAQFSPGERFFDHFDLTTLEDVDFYPDGRDLGENFTYTTWLQNPCMRSSQLNCVTCHTSSGRNRFAGEKANQACLPCHENKVQAIAQHSHHKTSDVSPKCVSCHMPMTEFARMKRSDHSMRPPMPAATLAFGSPNACNNCHTNKDAVWADRKVRQWHKDDYQAPVLEKAKWIADARKRDWSTLPAIVQYLSGAKRDEVVSVSLLRLLRACPNTSKWTAVIACLKDPSPLIRSAAVEVMADHPFSSPESLAPLFAATRDTYRLVRIRAANVLAGVPEEIVPEADRASLASATSELIASFMARPDDYNSAQNRGNYYLDRHDFAQAMESFERAGKLMPSEIAPLINLSMANSLAGQNEKAEANLKGALSMDPTNSIANLNLGMLLAELDRIPEAKLAFLTSFKSDPHSAQAAFNLGIIYAKEDPAKSLEWCQRAVELRPREPRYAYTLGFFQNQMGKVAEATATLEKLIAQNPPRADAYALLIKIYGESNKKQEAASVCKRATENPNLSDIDHARFQARLQALTQ